MSSHFSNSMLLKNLNYSLLSTGGPEVKRARVPGMGVIEACEFTNKFLERAPVSGLEVVGTTISCLFKSESKYHPFLSGGLSSK